MNKTLIVLAVAGLGCALDSCAGSQETANEAAAAGVEQNLPVYNIAQSDTSTVNKEHKTVLVLSASPRRGGNTDLLCDEFVRGAREAGGDVEKIFLDDYKIDFFHECHEHSADSVSADDQAPLIIEKMTKADIIVLSSPVYYMNIDGQLKTLMDRCYRNKGLGGKEFYYITACADAEDSTAETESGFCPREGDVHAGDASVRCAAEFHGVLDKGNEQQYRDPCVKELRGAEDSEAESRAAALLELEIVGEE